MSVIISPMEKDQYTVIGATSGPGLGIFVSLALAGHTVAGIARRSGPLEALSEALRQKGLTNARLLSVDLSQKAALPHALLEELSHTTHLIGASRAPFVALLMNFMPALKKVLALGSTRIYTQYPDARMHEMQAMVNKLSGQSVPWTVLHPTMIYGGTGYNNVERVKSLLRILPVIPLPHSGRALIQPVHNDDVVAAAMKVLDDNSFDGRAVVLAGPRAITYADFIETIARNMGKRARILNFPLGILRSLATVSRFIPFVPAIHPMEVQRLAEDKAFDITEMRQLLGREPMDTEEGLSCFYPLAGVIDRFKNRV